MFTEANFWVVTFHSICFSDHKFKFEGFLNGRRKCLLNSNFNTVLVYIETTPFSLTFRSCKQIDIFYTFDMQERVADYIQILCSISVTDLCKSVQSPGTFTYTHYIFSLLSLILLIHVSKVTCEDRLKFSLKLWCTLVCHCNLQI